MHIPRLAKQLRELRSPPESNSTCPQHHGQKHGRNDGSHPNQKLNGSNKLSNLIGSPSLLDLTGFHGDGCRRTGVGILDGVLLRVGHGCSILCG